LSGLQIQYQFDSTTGPGCPNGKMRLGSGGGVLYFDHLDRLGFSAVQRLSLASAYTSSIFKSAVRIVKDSDPTKFYSGMVMSSVYDSVNAEHSLTLGAVTWSSSNPFTNGDNVTMYITPVGERGMAGGAMTAAYQFLDTTTDSDPGWAKLRLNNSTQQNADVIRISDNPNAGGVSSESWEAVYNLLAASPSSNKGTLRIEALDGARSYSYAVYKITGIEDKVGYKNFQVESLVNRFDTHPLVSGEAVYVTFTPAGEAGPQGPAGQDGQTTSGGVTLWATNGFRLTLESNVPDDVVDRTGKSTIYWTPYTSDAIALWDGTKWVIRNVSERSIALSGLTAYKPYDVFVYDNAGTPTLEIGPAWTSDTVRSAGIERKNGVWVRSSDHTRRYVGSFRSTGTNTTQSTQTARLLYNVDNQLPTFFWTSTGPFTHDYSPSVNLMRKLNNSDAESTVWAFIGIPNRNVLTGDIGVYGSSLNGDAHIGISVTTYDGIDPTIPNNISLPAYVYGSARVTPRFNRLAQGLNYIRIVQYCGSNTNPNSYDYANHNLVTDM